MKSTLLGHLVSHSGEKPHKCDQCDKSFVRKGTLKKHVLKHHIKAETMKKEHTNDKPNIYGSEFLCKEQKLPGTEQKANLPLKMENNDDMGSNIN